MSYVLTRTSMALDEPTLTAIGELAGRWGVSKAEVMRRAVKRAKDEADRAEAAPRPLEALAWLQRGGGLTVKEAGIFRREVRAERQARVGWWQT